MFVTNKQRFIENVRTQTKYQYKNTQKALIIFHKFDLNFSICGCEFQCLCV